MEPVNSLPDQLAPFLFWAVGLCSLAWAVTSTLRTAGFLKRALEASGEVVRLQKLKGNLFYQRFGYVPVFRFKAADGRTHIVTSKLGSSPSGFALGDVVQVRYDPVNPDNAKIATLFQTWGQTVVAGVIAAIFIVPIILDKLGAFR